MADRHSLGCVCSSCLTHKRAATAARAGQGVGVPAQGGEAAGGYPTAAPEGCPPIGNTGETYTSPSTETVELVLADGRIKEVTRRVPAANECAVVDTIRITIHQNTFVKTSLVDTGPLSDLFLRADDALVREAFVDPLWAESFRNAQQERGCTLISDDDFVKEASRVFAEIFGFGVTRFTGKGRDFYRDAYVLGENFGYVCIGNAGKNDQQGTMLLELNGQGCINAKAGWEKRLHDFLAHVALRPSITRIDLAHDDMEGTRVTPDWAEAQWLAGGFTKCVGKNPNIERAGNWHEPNGNGRTLYVGSRKHSTLYVRDYEKGKEQGDPTSPWCRLEVEIKNSDRVIPFDVLLRPSDYFIATYPALAFLSAHRTPERIQVKRQKAQIGVHAAKEIIKHQFGKYLRVLRDLHDGDANALLDELVCDDPTAMPERLKVLGTSHDTFEGLYLHDIPSLQKWDIDTGRYVPAVAEKLGHAGFY